MRYFIKTEQEFIEEFGEKWRIETQWASDPNSSMNNLLGLELPENDSIVFGINNNYILSTQQC